MNPRSCFDEMRPYRRTVAEGEVRLRLDANEGPEANEGWCIRALASMPQDLLRRYPEVEEFETELASTLELDPSWVLLTAGADEAIDRIFRAYGGEGSRLIYPTPSFEMFLRYAKLSGAEVTEIPWRPGADWPLEEVVRVAKGNADETTIIPIVTPNNPTGQAIPRDLICRLCEAVPKSLVVLDSAYVEFADEDPLSLLRAAPNIIILRTFSKAWSLAGLRVGYAIARPELIRVLRMAGGPYSVSSLSIALAREAFQKRRATMEAGVARVIVERRSLCELLRDRGVQIVESQANFVLGFFPDAEGVWQRLRNAGIAVRRFPNSLELKNALRITCPGNAAEFDLLIAVLRKVQL